MTNKIHRVPKVVKYVNLTCGIEWLKNELEDDIRHVSFIRIQSTACEQKLWDKVLLDLDYDFLMHLALGDDVIVYDCSAHKSESRAMFQGIPWIKFAIQHTWFGKADPVIVSHCDCTNYFAPQYFKIKDELAIDKLKYFRKFLMTDQISLTTKCMNTANDGKFDFFRDILQRYK